MAIIRSNAIGDASKSMGEITYRKVGKAVVGSKRIVVNKSKSSQQMSQRTAFGEVGRLSKTLANISQLGFATEDRKSSQNMFVKLNVDYMTYLRENGVFGKRLSPLTNLCMTMADPLFLGEIFSGKGTVNIDQVISWDGADSIKVYVIPSRNFVEDDKIIIGIGYSFLRKGKHSERVKIYEKQLSEKDIEELNQPDEFLADKTTMPDFDIFGHLPPDANHIEMVVTALLYHETKEKKEYSTSLYYLMPDKPYQFKIASQSTVDGQTMKLVDENPEAFTKEFDGKLEGSILRQREEGDDFYTELPFAGYSKDDDNKVNGILIGTDEHNAYMDPFQGSPAAETMLIKDGVTLINLIGGLIPIFGG